MKQFFIYLENKNIVSEYVGLVLRLWLTNSKSDLNTGQVFKMSFRVHLKELIYLSVASLILLLLVWRMNSDSQESQLHDSRFSRLKFKFDQDLYRIKKVNIFLKKQFKKIFLNILLNSRGL